MMQRIYPFLFGYQVWWRKIVHSNFLQFFCILGLSVVIFSPMVSYLFWFHLFFFLLLYVSQGLSVLFILQKAKFWFH